MRLFDDNVHESGSGTTLPNIFPMVEILIFLLFAVIGTAAAGEGHILEEDMARVTAASKQPNKSAKVLTIEISADGQYRIGGRALPLMEVRKRISQLDAKAFEVLLQPHKDVRHEAVAQLSALCYELKIRCKEQVRVVP